MLTGLWHTDDAGMGHIHGSRGADLILVAPASADFLAKLAQGRADDLLSTLCLARACPLAVAPAMNREMWASPATQRNLAQLRADGVQVLGPAEGEQACGETGPGRMLEPAELMAALPALLGAGPLAGARVVVTAGPTFEPIDPVRGLTNLSSGRMGYAVAQAAAEAGATVCLVSGPIPTFSPRSRRAPMRRSAWASPPRPSAWPSTPRPSATRKNCRFWSAIWRRTLWARTAQNWCCSTRTVPISCRAPTNWRRHDP